MNYRITVFDSNHNKLADALLDADSVPDAESRGRSWFRLYHPEKARRMLIVEAVEEAS